MTICSRTIGCCFQEQYAIVLPIVLEFLQSNNSEKGYRNANFFPKRVVEILKKWAPPRQVTFKCPPLGRGVTPFKVLEIQIILEINFEGPAQRYKTSFQVTLCGCKVSKVQSLDLIWLK